MLSHPRIWANDAAWHQTDVVAIGEDHGWIGMNFPVLQTRHAMVQASGQFADLRVQRTAVGNVHLLKTAANAEHRHALGDAGLDQRQRQGVRGSS